MTKKVISVMLSIMIMFTAFTVVPLTASAETSGNFEYNLLEDGTVQITDYTGKDTKLEIPSTIDGHIVTSLGDSAFERCNKLKSVTIPEGVTTIGDRAFYSCEGFTSITIPESVKTIGNYAFYYCTSLTNITIQKGVRTIGEFAFYWCENLTSLTIPEGVKIIGDYAFSCCFGLVSITIPQGITNIEDYTFFDCMKMERIEIPHSVTSIGESAFENCKILRDVYYTGSESQWNSIQVGDCNQILTDSNIHYKPILTLNKSKATVYRTGKVTIKATVKNPWGKTTFVSGNTKVAKVNSKGVVTGVKAGTAKIIVRDNCAKKVFILTVKNPKLNKSKITLKKNKRFKLKITGKIGKAKFTTSNKKIAVVNNKGKIKAKKKGTATIKVKTNGITLKCKVKVK